MPILTQDIKILKSAFMADTSDGGGQMTGIEVIDGQSNNLFPDTSAMDRAFGRVNLRKVFGVAHTPDTDTLLGSHAIIVDAPDDPLVHCTLVKTAGWSDERDDAKNVVERYLTKGPKSGVRIYDTHYAGSLQLRLITFVGAPFPAGGDAIVLANPNGAEIYVRIVKVSISSQKVAATEYNNVVVLDAQICTCDLGIALTMDVLGPPACRAFNTGDVLSESSYAMIYTTCVAGGARFYGVKPLGVSGVVGDLSVVTDGGIYTPIVPASTVETPMIDIAPYPLRTTTASTGYTTMTLPSVSMPVIPNAVIFAPTPISPKSVALSAGGSSFTEVGDGVLLQNSVAVGVVDYTTGKITLNSDSPSFGTVSVTLTYKPATAVSSSPYSASLTVTIANQGLSFVNAFTPLPSPGTFQLDYMAQGRWYSLFDDLAGKLSGASNGYGVGTVNYVTGSMSVTLGAVPDVGSVLLASYGVGDAARTYVLANLPTKLSALIVVPYDKALTAVHWTSGGTAYSATAGSTLIRWATDGALGDVTWLFRPGTFPDGNVMVDYTLATPHSETAIVEHIALTPRSTAFTHSGLGGVCTDVSGVPIDPRSVNGIVDYDYPSDSLRYGSSYGTYFWDDGSGNLVADFVTPGGVVQKQVGTINYATGIFAMGATVTSSTWLVAAGVKPSGTWNASAVSTLSVGNGAFAFSSITQIGYCIGPARVVTYTSETTITYTYSTAQLSVTPSSWSLRLPETPREVTLNSAAFLLCGQVYTCHLGVLQKGWSVATGAPSVANVGGLSSVGLMSFSAVPTTGNNLITWLNLTHDVSTGRSLGGSFRTDSAPLKTGVFQLQLGELIGTANDAGVLSGAFTGSFDAIRGMVKWLSNTYINASDLTYNAVFLQYLPLDSALLGLDTSRLPLDGKLPIYHTGDLVVVHNTLTTTLPNHLSRDTAYALGRERIASVRVKDAEGVVVTDTLYDVDLDAGTLTLPTASNLTAYTEPLVVEHRIEDMLLCSQTDLSGELTFTRSLTHDFVSGTSFVSSLMPFGDLFARAYNVIEQSTWTGVWSDSLIGTVIIPQFNVSLCPIVVTNNGAIKERWALIFTNTTAFRVIGETVGEIGTGSTGANVSLLNTATGSAYFVIPALGWGNGWSTGNVLRFNTDACGSPFWIVRTVLQGPASLDSDQFTIAFRGDVDRP
jgi:hypothetical protein